VAQPARALSPLRSYGAVGSLPDEAVLAGKHRIRLCVHTIHLHRANVEPANEVTEQRRLVLGCMNHLHLCVDVSGTFHDLIPPENSKVEGEDGLFARTERFGKHRDVLDCRGQSLTEPLLLFLKGGMLPSAGALDRAAICKRVCRRFSTIPTSFSASTSFRRWSSVVHGCWNVDRNRRIGVC